MLTSGDSVWHVQVGVDVPEASVIIVEHSWALWNTHDQSGLGWLSYVS